MMERVCERVKEKMSRITKADRKQSSTHTHFHISTVCMDKEIEMKKKNQHRTDKRKTKEVGKGAKE